MSGNIAAGKTEQSSFVSTEEKINSVLELLAQHEFDHVFGLASGGTDSLLAIDAYNRYHERHDLPAIDAVVHTNTGTTLPQTQETVYEFCADQGLPFMEVRNQDPKWMLAPRMLEHGWCTERTHPTEFIYRKKYTWDRVYSSFPGRILFISGGRVAESDRRAANLGDSAVDIGETGDRMPRLSWVAPAHGVLDSEKEVYIEEYGIPETIAYDWVGYSGDCIACAFDNPQVLNEVRVLCPELAYALESLVVWVHQRIKRGEIDQPVERSVWGTAGIEEDARDTHDPNQRGLDFGGCGSCSKSCYANNNH